MCRLSPCDEPGDALSDTLPVREICVSKTAAIASNNREVLLNIQFVVAAWNCHRQVDWKHKSMLADQARIHYGRGPVCGQLVLVESRALSPCFEDVCVLSVSGLLLYVGV